MKRLIGNSIILLALAFAASAAAGDPASPDPVYQLERPDLGFTLESRRPLMEERHWNGVENPRKFIHQMVVEAGDTQVFVQYWPLATRSGHWWIETVMGFLFQPETTVSQDVTSSGYDATWIVIPAGPQADSETNVLVTTPTAAFRFICPDCEAGGGLADLEHIVDSVYLLDSDD